MSFSYLRFYMKYTKKPIRINPAPIDYKIEYLLLVVGALAVFAS